MATEFVSVERRGAVALLSVNRPKALNALNAQTLRELDAALKEVAVDAGVRALVVTGAGDKAFVAGADISELSAMTPTDALAFSTLGQRAFDALEALAVPTIAAVNGFALGGGCELALACDLLYASEKAKLGLPEVTLAVIPGFGGTQRLARRVGAARAKELVFTGDTVDAQRAKELGLALEVLPPDKLLPHCLAVAERIAQRGPLAVAQAKRVMVQGVDLPQAAGCALERQAFAALFGTEDQREGMWAFLEKRPAAFRGR